MEAYFLIVRNISPPQKIFSEIYRDKIPDCFLKEQDLFNKKQAQVHLI
jgi:hypothetical protein